MRSPFSDAARAVGKDENDIESPFHEIERSFSLTAEKGFSPTVGMDFHGDGTDGDVAVVWTNSKLRDRVMSKFFEHGYEFPFKGGIMDDLFGPGFRSLFLALKAILVPSSGNMGGLGLVPALGVRHAGPFEQFGFGSGSGLDIVLDQPSLDSISVSPHDLGGGIDGVSRDEEGDGPERLAQIVGANPDKVIDIGYRKFAGHVYNLQSGEGFGSYIAQNVIVGNCRCAGAPYIKSTDGPVKVQDADNFI